MIETSYIAILIAGFGGGVVRGLVGFTKHQFAFKNVRFNLAYFMTMMFISGIIGVLTATAVNASGFSLLGIETINPAIAFIIGYAGGDFLENVYKIITKKQTIFKSN